VLLVGGALLALVVIIQCLYPANRLALFTVIDGVSLSGWQKTDAIRQLDTNYKNQSIPIYFGVNGRDYSSPKPAEIGLIVSNQDRVDKINYPWYLRIIPTSIFWVHFITESGNQPTYQRNSVLLNDYIDQKLSSACNIQPQDASLKTSGAKLVVTPSYYGGTCDVSVVHQTLSTVRPQLSSKYRLIIPVKETAPKVNESTAQVLLDSLDKKIGDNLLVAVGSSNQAIPSGELYSWMDFSVVDSKLTYTLNQDRATKYLNSKIASKVAVSAGTTTVTTYNFVEKSRKAGVMGQVFDLNDTLKNFKSYLDGDSKIPDIATISIEPKIVYERSYSSTDTGLSALMKNYADSHPGTYGVSMVELSGKNRRAAYNDTRVFITASTYKLFVAYSTLRRIESGAWSWTDHIADSRNLTACFHDMIAYSDNTCAVALLNKVGRVDVTNEAHGIGCVHTSFLHSDGIETTPADLTLLLAQLKMGQILSQQSSRDTLINTMKLNVYRTGIPTGISGSIVADKVGFLNGLLHDASIVFSPTGTYVLVIMTDGSSWGNIANLAKQIEALRVQ
jgi:beta-lactamase class A